MFLTLLGFSMVIGSIMLYDDNKNRICKSTELNSITGEGIKISKHIRLSEKQSNEHILMVAPSGIGKSRRFFMHNVNELKNCSIICTDPSGEIESTCITDKKVYVLNPFSSNSIGYNPLLNCNNEFEVRKIAKTILQNGMVQNKENGKQQEWVDMATPLFTAYMLFNWKTNKYSFSEMINRVCTMPIAPQYVYNDKKKERYRVNEYSLFEEIIESKYNAAINEMKFFMQVLGADNTTSSIRIVLNTCLQMFKDESVVNILNKNNIDIAKLRQEESIIYIQIPERHADYYKPLTATFISQLFDSLFDNNNGLQVYMLFDEFCNIGIIPNIDKILSTARKSRISIVSAIQSLIQLEKVYGEIAGKEISELFSTLIVGSSLKESTEYISKLVGVKTIKSNKNNISKEIMTSNEIRCMDINKILIICKNKRPVIDDMMGVVA